MSQQFGTWRYWLVGTVMLLAVLLALPNVFQQDEALQLARKDRVAIDAAQEQQLKDLLNSQGAPVLNSYLEGGRLVLSFETPDAQIKARDVLVDQRGADYGIALTRVSRAPAWVRAVGLKPMSLGLDLRGGVRLLYEVDTAAAISQTLERLERDIRTTLREKRIPFVSMENAAGRLRVTLRDASQVNAAIDAVTKLEDGLLVEASSDGIPGLTVGLTEANIQERQTAAIQQNVVTLRNRVDQLGVAEPYVARQGKNRIVVQLPGVQDQNEAKRVLGSTATLEWHMVDQSNDAREAERTRRVPLGSKLYKMREDGSPILLKRELIVTGDQMTDARSEFVQGEPAVGVRLDSAGGDRMLKNTQQNLGKLMAVLFIEKKRLGPGEQCDGVRSGDQCTEEKVISAATIQGVFGPQFQITGLTASEGRELALLLRAGSLATPIYPLGESTVGPSLGADNISKGFFSMLIGMSLTFAFMTFYYRWFGLVACVVLTANVVLLIAAMSFLGATFGAALSLPGIAGIVLTVGMAADANVLIYERIREEVRIGNSPHAAINAGFEKAFSAIADSNITTLIAGITLFAVGSGPIKGFAVTLMIGIATSLFTAILGSRVLIQLIWGRRRQLASLPV